MLQVLAYFGADVGVRDQNGRTPLHAAAASNADISVFRELLRMGARIEEPGAQGLPPLATAIVAGNAAGVEALLKLGADPTLGDRLERSALYLAAEATREPEVIRVLVRWGLDVNRRAATGNRPLHIAARDNQEPAVIEALIDAGARVNVVDPLWKTPLIYAAWKNPNPEVVLTLLRRGADARHRDAAGMTALDYLLMSNAGLRGSEAEAALRRALGR